jgi:hypothetical protein
MKQPPQMVGLFGLPTQKDMEKVMVTKVTTATDDLKTHITKELKTPMLLVSVASLAIIFYLVFTGSKGK